MPKNAHKWQKVKQKKMQKSVKRQDFIVSVLLLAHSEGVCVSHMKDKKNPM